MKIVLLCTDSDRWGFGIRILSSVLRREGHSTRLIFLCSDAAQYTIDVLEQAMELARGADLLGVSCYSRGSRRASQLIRNLTGLGIPILWGGLHATLNPHECALLADMVCRGEGEEAIVELAATLKSGKDWRSIRNLAYADRDELTANPLRPPIDNLDTLPLFDFQRNDEFHLARGVLIKSPQVEPACGQVYFVGSRGCAFRCTYCCNRTLKELYAGHGNYIRKMSIAGYMEHVETLHQKHFPNASDFYFLDEDFFARSVREIAEFAELYRERVGIPFECLASPARISRDKMEHLSKAGLWRVRMGVESGSDRTKREVYERPLSNAVVLRAANVVRSYRNVVPCYFFIIGNPYEDQADLIATLRFMDELSYPYYSHMYNLVFFPGSSLYERAIRDGVITGIGDSGAELHFRQGLQYKAHSWKHKNLYLNALLFLAEGRATRYRLGLLPRFLLRVLTLPGVIRSVERCCGISRALITSKFFILFIRAKCGTVLKKVIRHPGGVYNLPRLVSSMLRHLIVPNKPH